MLILPQARIAANHRKSTIIDLMWWRRTKLILKTVLVVAGIITLVVPEWPVFQEERYRLNTLVGLREFDFLTWELNALREKGMAEAGDGHAYLDEDARKEAVLFYLELVASARRLDEEVRQIYADPEVTNPDVASGPLRQELADTRATLTQMQPLAETIVQEQVASVLAEEGFGLLGEVWPPVQMRVTPLPEILIVSPRDEIRQIYNVPLVAGLSVPEKETLETGVFEHLERSALVVPIGGLGFYPAMIVETANINFLADVVAHEWAHHWLTLHPVGLRYAVNPAMRTINETTASIVGEEIGARVIERFYPEFAPPPAPEGAPAEAPPEPAEPASFDFRAEMAETRVRVDELLAEGKVEEAEAYMESRRRLFVDNGHLIRKLNQAYFAFYGAYADTPGASGSDPVGPTVVALRERSPSLRDFMDQIAGVTTFAELEAIMAE